MLIDEPTYSGSIDIIFILNDADVNIKEPE